MRPILITVAMCGRLDLAGLTLDMIERQKSHLSDVLVLVDPIGELFDSPSAEKRWPQFEFWYCKERMGAAKMARERVRHFLEDHNKNRKFLLTLDSDLLLAKLFDLRMMNLFLEATSEPNFCHDGTLLSGYRSSSHLPIEFKGPNLLSMLNVGGCCQFMSPGGARTAFNAMEDKSRWHAKEWDHNWAKCFPHLVAPVRSLAEHTGRHGSGHNGYSDDVAVGFELYGG